MDETPVKKIIDDLRNETRQMASSIREAAASLQQANTPAGEPGQVRSLMDPFRLKRLLIALLKILIVVELVSAFLQGTGGGSWSRFGIDLVVAGLFYLLSERILALVREQNLSARARMESAHQATRLWDALVFSLLSMRFKPDSITVRQGDTLRLRVRNAGKVLHELVIGTDKELQEHAELMKKHPDMEHDEPYMAHIDPGKRGEIVWQFTRTGDFKFACLIPGHFEAGMVGTIKVLRR